MADAESSLQADQSSFKSAIEGHGTFVAETVQSFTESMNHVTEQLQQQSHDVDHFLADELRKDVPTGICCSFFKKKFIFYILLAKKA